MLGVVAAFLLVASVFLFARFFGKLADLVAGWTRARPTRALGREVDRSDIAEEGVSVHPAPAE